jgi:hypothetical protein
MVNKNIILFLGIMMVSALLTSYTTDLKAQESATDEEEEEEEEDNNSYDYFEDDDYAQNYDKNYLKDNAIKINEINNIVEEKNRQLSKQALPEDENMDRSNLLASESKIAFVLPTFTMAAYDFTFYPFFSKYADVKHNEFVTSDIDLLTASLPTKEQSFNSYKAIGLHHLRDFTSFLLPNAELNYLSDEDVHNGLIFTDTNINFYDILVLAHSEYVTQQEYYNFKKFVENGGVIILLDANALFAEVAYDPLDNKISLVKGHYWAFDGQKAWRDVKERWAAETTQWVGNNFGCSSCVITFGNNPFSYQHHEENYITNPNVKILIDYEAQSQFNYLIAAHELKYGLGKVISLGIFGSDVADNDNFLKFYEDLLLNSI